MRREKSCSAEIDGNSRISWYVHTLTGHVSAGETSLGTVHRELAEELGLEADLRFCFSYRKSVKYNAVFDNQFCDVFVGYIDSKNVKLTLQESEVKTANWMDWKKFKAMVNSGSNLLVPAYIEAIKAMEQFDAHNEEDIMTVLDFQGFPMASEALREDITNREYFYKVCNIYFVSEQSNFIFFKMNSTVSYVPISWVVKSGGNSYADIKSKYGDCCPKFQFSHVKGNQFRDVYTMKCHDFKGFGSDWDEVTFDQYAEMASGIDSYHEEIVNLIGVIMESCEYAT